MNTRSAVLLAVVGGFGLGVSAVEGLRAQAKPPAFLIAEVQVKSQEAMKPYQSAVPGIVTSYGGKVIVAGGTVVSLEGDAPQGRVIVFQFESLERAQSYRNSESYQKILPIRLQNAISRVYVVEGVAN